MLEDIFRYLRVSKRYISGLITLGSGLVLPTDGAQQSIDRFRLNEPRAQRLIQCLQRAEQIQAFVGGEQQHGAQIGTGADNPSGRLARDHEHPGQRNVSLLIFAFDTHRERGRPLCHGQLLAELAVRLADKCIDQRFAGRFQGVIRDPQHGLGRDRFAQLLYQPLLACEGFAGGKGCAPEVIQLALVITIWIPE